MIHAIGMHQEGATYTPFEQSCRAEYAAVLVRHRPELYVLSREPHNLAMFAYQDPETIVRSIPQVDSLLRSAYVLDTVIGPYECYRLRRRLCRRTPEAQASALPNDANGRVRQGLGCDAHILTREAQWHRRYDCSHQH
jgi:hypothetical protein